MIEFAPQQAIDPSSFTPQALLLPVETLLNRPLGGVVAPQVSSPQQVIEPSVFTAQ